MSGVSTVTATPSVTKWALFLAWLGRWIQQPTTVLGFATLFGDVVMVLTGAVTWRVELPVAAGALIAMVLPDNTAVAAVLVRTLRDILAAIATRDPAAIAAAVGDAEQLLTELEAAGGTKVAIAIKT